MVEDREICKSTDMNDNIAKPIDSNDLISIMDNFSG
jgi:hypothetical protein